MNSLKPVLHQVSEGDYFFAVGWGGKSIWVNDAEKAVFDEAQQEYEIAQNTGVIMTTPERKNYERFH